MMKTIIYNDLKILVLQLVIPDVTAGISIQAPYQMK